MRNIYPKADTISGLSALLKNKGAQELLDWYGEDELERFSLTVRFFEKEHIETFDNLRDWLKPDNRDRLITKSSLINKAGIPKIANATADYYLVLVGLPDAVKVDTLVQKFLVEAGIVNKHTYEEKRSIVQLAAKQLEKRPIDLDGAIWNYEEKRNKEKDEMEQDEGLTVPLPKDKIEQLEKVAQREFGVNGTGLARFWIIDRLLNLTATQTQSTSGELSITPKDESSVTQKVASLITARIKAQQDPHKVPNTPWEICVTRKGEYSKLSEQQFHSTRGDQPSGIPITLCYKENTCEASLHRSKRGSFYIGTRGNTVVYKNFLKDNGFFDGNNKIEEGVGLNFQGNNVYLSRAGK